MENICVRKDDLLVKIRENRDAHRSQFLKAQEVYRERVIAELDTRLAQARGGGVINLGFQLPAPVDYTAEYDTAIEMLEWEQADEVELGEHDFQRYVQNRWEWARNFAASTEVYLS